MAGPLTLYQLPAAFRGFLDELVETGGELTPAMVAEHDALLTALVDHAEDVAAMVQEAKALGRAARDEANRLRTLADQRDRAAARLIDLLRAAMEAAETPRIVTDRFRIGIAKNGRPSIRWGGLVDSIPAPYRRVDVRLDGEAVYQAWKNGTLDLDDDRFVIEQGSHLRIS